MSVLDILKVKDEQGNWHAIPALKGNPGDDGYSPEVTVERITGGHRITITDATGPHTFDVMDGDGSTYDAGDVTYDPSEDYAGGSVGAALNEHNTEFAGKLDKSAQAQKTADMTQPVGVDSNGKLWALPGGGGGTTDYTALTNKPKVNNVELSGNKTGSQLGLASADDIPDRLSELTDDLGSSPVHTHAQYLTEHQSLAAYRTATAQDAIDAGKVDKISGKGLSTNDYTTAEKNKLAGIASGAEVNVQSDWNQSNTSADDYIKNKPTIPVVPANVSAFVNDAGYLTQHQDISGKIDKSAQAAKTTGMTSPVGIDENGKLWSTPGGGSGGGAVDSVNGMTGDVVLDAEDVGALPDDTVIPTALSDLSADATHRTVTDIEKSTWNGKGTYSKPSGGIPKTDLASAVQTSLGLADTALQSFTETDPVFSASAAHGISASDITNWNGKGTYSKPSGGIPKTDLATAVQTSLGLADTALQEHQDISGKQDKTDNTLTTTSKTVAGAINEIDSELSEQSQQIADKISISVQKEKTTGMTSPVGIDSDGKLWSTPGGGSGGGGTAEDITYDPDEEYSAGTVGEELSTQGQQITLLESDIAEAYDETATYSAGDYAMFDGVLKKYNGTTWTAVNVTDEIGSGGGGWELIIDETLSSPVIQFVRTQDMNGNPFNLKKVVLYVKGVNDTENTTVRGGLTFDSDINGSWGVECFYRYAVLQKKDNYTPCFVVGASVIDDLVIPDFSWGSPRTGNYAQLGVTKSTEMNTDTGFDHGLNTKKIDKLQLASYSTTFLAGTRIRMWGIRV